MILFSITIVAFGLEIVIGTPVTSRTLYKLLHERYALSYTTVTNMLYRLVSQDLLIRHYDRRAAISLYCPTCGLEEYIRQVTAQLRTAVGLEV